MGLRILLVVSMIGLWFAMSPTRSYACSCGDPGTPAEALAISELVFRGTVSSIGSPDEEGWLDVEFDVVTVWKGTDAPTKTLTTHQDSATCGYPFEAGVEYVVYSHNSSNVGICGRTAPVEFAGEDLAAFESGDQTGQDAGFPNTGSGGLAGKSRAALTPMEMTALAAGSGALLLGGVWLGLRRRRLVG